MDLFSMLTVIYKYKKLYEKRCCEIMKEYELRIADLDILYYIAHSGSRNLAKDIVDLGMSKAHVSKSVDRLRRRELVVLREDKEDRRCVHIELTQKAMPVVNKLSVIRREMGESLSEGISYEDKEAVIRVMRQVGENMNIELMNMSGGQQQRGQKEEQL